MSLSSRPLLFCLYLENRQSILFFSVTLQLWLKWSLERPIPFQHPGWGITPSVKQPYTPSFQCRLFFRTFVCVYEGMWMHPSVCTFQTQLPVCASLLNRCFQTVWIWCCFLYFILRKVFCYNFFLDFKKYHIYCLLHLGFFWSQCCKWCFQPYLYETYYKCLYMESYKHHNKAWICRSQTRLNTP